MWQRHCSVLASTAARAAPCVENYKRPKNVDSRANSKQLQDLEVPLSYSSLSNGFRIACEHIPGLEFSTIGVWIDAGSRFETRQNNGVAHFLEHLNFKGTTRFTRRYVESLFEQLGAHLNAYTSRDRTAYYIKMFNSDAEKMLELLADILRNGKYDPKDIESERPTILSEMREVEELVDEVIMDNLHLAAFDASTSGLPLTILGPSENILDNITRDTILEYVNTHYTGPRMSLVSSGGLTHKEVEAIGKKFFGDLPAVTNRPILKSKYIGGHYSMWNMDMKTSHVVVGFPICGAEHKDSIPLQVLQSIYGTYRKEQHDIFAQQGLQGRFRHSPDVELIQPFYTPYEEVGLLGYYFVSLPSAAKSEAEANRTMDGLIQSSINELRTVAEDKISPEILEMGKANFKAMQLLAADSTTNSAEDIGRQVIHYGRRLPKKEVFEMVDSITPQSLGRLARKYFFSIRPVVSCIGPPQTLPDYDALVRLQGAVGNTH